jgi:hypothetical protein
VLDCIRSSQSSWIVNRSLVSGNCSRVLRGRYCEVVWTGLPGSRVPLFPPCISRQNKQPSLEDVSLTQTSIVISGEHNAANSSFLILSLRLYIGQHLTEYLSGVILFQIKCKFCLCKKYSQAPTSQWNMISVTYFRPWRENDGTKETYYDIPALC